MKKLWNLLKYYYFWQPVIPLAVGIGLFLFILKVVFTNTSPGVTFFLGMASFAFLFIVPFFSGASALRRLISNPQTSMVPGLRLQAGIAYMLIAVIASVFLYTNFLVFAPDDYSPYVILRTFACFSLYAGLMQLILPSRFFITIVSVAPIVVVMILLRFDHILIALFLDPGVTLAYTALVVAGWIHGLHLLATQNRFAPGCDIQNNAEAWSSYDGGFLARMAIGRERTAEGTLLLGYPDNWGGIVLRVLHYFIITPLMTTGGMFLIGITEEWDGPMLDSLFRLFLMISLFSGVFCIFIYGELVARARLIWLRYGTDRFAQWQLVDKYCFSYLMIYYLCGACIVLLSALLAEIPGVFLLHYLLILFSYSAFNLYFSLYAKTARLPALGQVLVVIVTIFFIILGIVSATVADTPTFIYIVNIEWLLALLAIAFRMRVKSLFTGIDWRLVTINKTPNKMMVNQK